MASLTALGIETLTLDVQSSTSISACFTEIASKKGGLDILVNNAGASYSMPFSDMSTPTAKALFDLNVWSYLEVTQAFLPLLLASRGTLVSQTSVASVCTVPFQSTYNASKAAMAMFSDYQRLELAPFAIRVIELKTGAVGSNFFKNATDTQSLPEGSIYLPAREAVEKTMAGTSVIHDGATDTTLWAQGVVGNVLKKTPPANIWSGAPATLAMVGTVLLHGMLDGTLKKMTGLDVVEKAVGAKQKSG
jgi:1-acylglycerone phosphate reductase